MDGTLSYANPAFADMFGYSYSNDVFGKQIIDLIDDNQVNSQLNEGLRIYGHWVGDMVCHRKDGSEINIELYASLMKDEVGKPLCYMGSFLDITERKSIERWRRLYEQLLNSLLEIRQSSSMLSEKEITQQAVEDAVIITGSEMGYLHFVDEDKGEIHLTSWIEGAMNACTVDQQGHCPLEKAGI